MSESDLQNHIDIKHNTKHSLGATKPQKQSLFFIYLFIYPLFIQLISLRHKVSISTVPGWVCLFAELCMDRGNWKQWSPRNIYYGYTVYVTCKKISMLATILGRIYKLYYTNTNVCTWAMMTSWPTSTKYHAVWGICILFWILVLHEGQHPANEEHQQSHLCG